MSEKKNKFDTELIRELAAIIKESDLGEIEIEDEDLRIRVSRHEPAPVSIAAPVTAAAAPAALPAAPAAVAAPVEAASAAAAPVDAVTSPMVGTVYMAPEPGAPDFIKEGDTVKEGQTLLLIEAMKTFNPVTAPKAGKITRIIVEDAQPVEYGEPLVVIE
ncbi:MAG: acetyl-CoA carboxylase, biotin carboxyl carrier protein [Hirschia sp.]|nr:acetyl-CoA carboxylase, biotin carboxyl carrier protein [Hirschia sp.]MBF17263.1 acetyl-CoA carboxylase, biotin carboxyl carrier protein [Hirschia sp.]|tara:strand:- start:957 stop:1436 length:480 start_codon:yes stop_codon:yes gene_type:complete